MVIGIAGLARSGKDTAADYLVKNYDFTKIAFANELKKMCEVNFDLKHDQLHGDYKDIIDRRYNKTPREIMHLTGQFYRSILPTFLIDKCLDKLYMNKNYVISDCRMGNEWAAIKKLEGSVWKIERDSKLRGIISNPNDISERDLVNNEFDLTIDNNKDFIHLYNQIDNWMINHDLY